MGQITYQNAAKVVFEKLILLYFLLTEVSIEIIMPFCSRSHKFLIFFITNF